MSAGLFYTMGLNPSNFLAGAGRAMGAINGVKSGMGGLASMAAKATAAFAALGAGAAAVAGISKAIQSAADFERASIAFETLIGNAERAQAALGQLKQFANTTPFELGEIQQAAIALLNANVEAEQLTTYLTALGNASSVTGAKINEMASALGKGMNKGTLDAEVMEMFSDRGVNAYKLVADQLGVTWQAARKLGDEGQLGADLLVAGLKKVYGEGGKLGGLMSRQAASTLGLFSTLKDSVDQLFLAFGQPLNDAIKPILQGAIGLAESLQPIIAGLGQDVGRVVTAFHGLVANASQGGSVIGGLMSAVGSLFSTLGEFAKEVGGVFLTVALGFGGALVDALGPFISKAIPAMQFAMQSVAASFAEAMFGALREINQSLPMWLKLDDKALQRGSMNARASGDNYAGGARSAWAQAKSNVGPGLNAGADRLAATFQQAVDQMDVAIGRLGDRAKAALPAEIMGPPAFLKELDLVKQKANNATTALGGLNKKLGNVPGGTDTSAAPGGQGDGPPQRKRILSFNAAQSAARRAMRLSPAAQKYYDGTFDNHFYGKPKLNAEGMMGNFAKSDKMGSSAARAMMKRNGSPDGFRNMGEFIGRQGNRIFGGMTGGGRERGNGTSVMEKLLNDVVTEVKALNNTLGKVKTA